MNFGMRGSDSGSDQCNSELTSLRPTAFQVKMQIPSAGYFVYEVLVKMVWRAKKPQNNRLVL